MKSEIDVLLDWKPLGQKIIDNDLMIITKDEINKKLKRQEVIESSRKRTMLKGKGKAYPIYDYKYSVNTDDGFEEYKCKLIRENLDHYLLKIPERILIKVREAKHIGLTEFFIYYLRLTKSEKIKDPVITAKFGVHELFITQY